MSRRDKQTMPDVESWIGLVDTPRFIVRAVTVLAPKSPVDFVLKLAGWVFGTVILRLVLTLAATQGVTLAELVKNGIIGATVATVFITIGLTLVMHQYKLQLALAKLALTDLLTGLANRRAFMAEAEARIDSEDPIIILLLDLDHFKRINDTFGHDIGDQCLKTFAEFMRRAVRQGDLAARVGGEEFAVLLDNGTSQEVAVALGGRIASGTSAQLVTDVISLTASVGFAQARPGEGVAEVLSRADAALYNAKETGRARLVLARAA
ncbi:MAG: GGDEF domain-containing protein [Pseudomonadota bacterium]